MSSSFRNSAALVVAGLVVAQGAYCADWYYIPEADVRAEVHSNLTLETAAALVDSNEAYVATIGTIIGARTPRWTTELRPRVRLQQYPDHSELQRTNGYLDLRSSYRAPRGSFDLTGSFYKEDRFQSELSNAGYDPFDPNDPTVSASGRLVLTSETRTRVQLRPSFSYQLNERVDVGADIAYEKSDFNGAGAAAGSDYDDSSLEGYLGWELTPRTVLQTGAYVGRYETGDSAYKADSTGLTLELKHDWTETLSGNLRTEFERTKVQSVADPEDTSNNWGATAEVRWRGQVSNLRGSVGRRFTPSDYGVRSTIDEVRLQYDRQVRERWSWVTALRGFETRSQGATPTTNDRKYLRAEFELQWLMTRTWFLGGGYNYTWQEYALETDSANDNTFFVRIGYKGLRPPRR